MCGTYHDSRVDEARLQAAYAAIDADRERIRPFYMLSPRVYLDGNSWCALYGENIQQGVAGFGETPAKAADDFDSQWFNAKAELKGESRG